MELMESGGPYRVTSDLSSRFNIRNACCTSYVAFGIREFHGHVQWSVVSIRMKIHIIILDNMANRQHVYKEQKGAKN